MLAWYASCSYHPAGHLLASRSDSVVTFAVAGVGVGVSVDADGVGVGAGF